MKYVEKGLLGEISRKLNYLERRMSPESILKKGKILDNKILKAAQYQSFRIEYPNSGSSYSIPRNCNKQTIKEGVENIENAFNWGKKFFKGEVNEDFIKELSIRITPEIYSESLANYRDSGTRILGATTTPPDPYKVREKEMPWFVDSLNKKLKYPDKISQILASFFAHLHLVRIHPFQDGNGRTSRTLQDIILDFNGIPTPIINSGERYTYFDFLDKAVYDWKRLKSSGEICNGSTGGEQGFYTFMAGKLNDSLDKVVCSIK
ncbi:MAG: Fic family protein [Candidatus Pacearchaeota archaeon]